MTMQMVGAFAEFERAIVRERTSAAASAESGVGGGRRKLDDAKCREIAESVTSGRKSGADMSPVLSFRPQPTEPIEDERLPSPLLTVGDFEDDLIATVRQRYLHSESLLGRIKNTK
jgi:hypothetical protein